MVISLWTNLLQKSKHGDTNAFVLNLYLAAPSLIFYVILLCLSLSGIEECDLFIFFNSFSLEQKLFSSKKEDSLLVITIQSIFCNRLIS